jgi:predicted nucleotidyltransferase component of viral defense system
VNGKTNLAASIRARLLNRARADNVEFQQMLTQFATERLLYRLSISPHKDQLLLKGALLFELWFHEPHRPTQDVDFLGFGPDDLPRITAMFRDICAMSAEDGITFDPASVRAREIRIDANYGGVRVTLMGMLDNARCPVQADIGFGDAVTQEPEETTYPTLFPDLPAPRLRVYTRYTVVAEKYHAIVEHGMQNSRMKDFFDLWVLTRRSEFDPATLLQAITATFTRRGTTLPAGTPVGLSDEFATNSAKQAQWRGFAAKSRIDVQSLEQVVSHLRGFFSSLDPNNPKS